MSNTNKRQETKTVYLLLEQGENYVETDSESYSTTKTDIVGVYASKEDAQNALKRDYPEHEHYRFTVEEYPIDTVELECENRVISSHRWDLRDDQVTYQCTKCGRVESKEIVNGDADE